MKPSGSKGGPSLGLEIDRRQHSRVNWTGKGNPDRNPGRFGGETALVQIVQPNKSAKIDLVMAGLTSLRRGKINRAGEDVGRCCCGQIERPNQIKSNQSRASEPATMER